MHYASEIFVMVVPEFAMVVAELLHWYWKLFPNEGVSFNLTGKALNHLQNCTITRILLSLFTSFRAYCSIDTTYFIFA